VPVSLNDDDSLTKRRVLGSGTTSWVSRKREWMAAANVRHAERQTNMQREEKKRRRENGHRMQMTVSTQTSNVNLLKGGIMDGRRGREGRGRMG
jgi:hypothetical protein